jgi:hypothetical protein
MPGPSLIRQCRHKRHPVSAIAIPRHHRLHRPTNVYACSRSHLATPPFRCSGTLIASPAPFRICWRWTQNLALLEERGKTRGQVWGCGFWAPFRTAFANCLCLTTRVIEGGAVAQTFAARLCGACVPSPQNGACPVLRRATRSQEGQQHRAILNASTPTPASTCRLRRSAFFSTLFCAVQTPCGTHLPF